MTTYIEKAQLTPILKNKPPVVSTVDLRICLSVGSLTTENQWIDKFPSSAIIEVKVNQHVLFSGNNAHQQISLRTTLTDLQEYNTHRIQIKLDSLDRCTWNDELNPMLRIDGIWIDDANIINTLNDTAKYIHATGSIKLAGQYMGCNGCIELTITTPIYRWLFENYK